MAAKRLLKGALALAFALAAPLFLAQPLRAQEPSMRSVKEKMFAAMLRAGEASPQDRENVLAFYDLRLADINGDGEPEYFLTGPCGKICRCRAFATAPDGGMDLLLSADCMPEGLTVLPGAGENGWKTLMAPIASYASGGVKRFYAFKDGVYRLSRKECYAFAGDGGKLVRTDCPKGMP